MSIRLVALDLDGTLLDPHNRITPRTAAAVAATAARGARVAIVTGRMYISAVPYAAELHLADHPLVSYNGALVKEYPSGRQVAHRPVPLPAAQVVLELCRDRGYYVQGYWDDTCYVEQIIERTERYCRNAGVDAVAVGPLLRYMKEPPTKLLIFEPEERIPGIEAELRVRLGDSVNTAASFPYFLEITHPEATKGRALAALAAHYGFGPENVLAVGDANNDLSMLTWAGHSGVMAHAVPEVQAAATYVASAPPGDGVAEVLERFILQA